MLNQKYMSLDGIQNFIYDTTNNNLFLLQKVLLIQGTKKYISYH